MYLYANLFNPLMKILIKWNTEDNNANHLDLY